MSKHCIKFRLSPEGQKQAVLEGLPAASYQELEFQKETINDAYRVDPLTLKNALDLGANIDREGSVVLDASFINCSAHYLDTPPRDALHALRLFSEDVAKARTAAAAKEKADAEKAAAEQAASAARVQAQENTQDQWLTPYLSGSPKASHPWPTYEEYGYYKAPQLEQDRYESCAPVQVELVNQETARRAAAVKAAKLAEESAKAQADLAREQRMAELVAPLDASAKERIEAAGGDSPLGLVPGSEALEILRDHYLPIPSGLKAYVNMQQPDVCTVDMTEDYPHDDYQVSFLKFEGEDLPDITRENWSRIKLVVDKLLNQNWNVSGEPVLVAHRGRCEKHGDCCPDVWRYGLKMFKDLGHGLVLEREYGV